MVCLNIRSGLGDQLLNPKPSTALEKQVPATMSSLLQSPYLEKSGGSGPNAAE